jgi:hypothetical protein
MNGKVTHTTKRISYVGAGLLLFLTDGLVRPAKADLLSDFKVVCNGAAFYKEGPDGTLTCTIFNPFHNVLSVPNVNGKPAITLAIAPDNAANPNDSGDVARDPKLAATPACFGNIPAEKTVDKAKKFGECSFDVVFKTDEKDAPKTGDVENPIDQGSWLFSATVLTQGSGDKQPAAGTFNIIVKDAPEPSSLFLAAMGVLLSGISRAWAWARPDHFSRVTSTLPNFSSAGPICLASPTTTIAD